MTTYLYRLSSELELLYVGITKNPTIRFTNHAANQPWWSEVQDISLVQYPSLDKALAAERLAIDTEEPRYNKRNDVTHPHALHDLIRPEKMITKRELPVEEVQYLMSLETDEEVLARSYELYRAGWPMKELVRYTRLRPSSSYLRTKFGETVPEVTGRPLPAAPELIPPSRKASRARGLGTRVSARAITVREADILVRLASEAKLYRASYSSSHPAAKSVEQYKAFIRHLHDDQKITIPDIARAAGVDPSTILRRYRS